MKLYWHKKQPTSWTSEAREGASLIQIGNLLYMFGGLSRVLHKDTQLFNLEKFKWIKPQEFRVKHSPAPRFNHSAVLYFDHIIVFGGEQTFNPQTKLRNTLNDLLLFNSQSYEWEQIHYGGMYFSRTCHVAAIVAHHMLVYGGINEEGEHMDELLALNLGTFKWMPCPVEGENPGKLAHMTCCTVVHPERASKKTFTLFKNP